MIPTELFPRKNSHGTIPSGNFSRLFSRRCFYPEASNINSTSDIVVTVGQFECWGRPGWTEWNQWSLCSASCVGGDQVRSRECEGRQSKCVGEAVQSRPCNQFACAEWAAWSDWSKCIDSVTKAPKPCGQKERTRTCQGSGRCEGNAIQYTQCDCGNFNNNLLLFFINDNLS